MTQSDISWIEIPQLSNLPVGVLFFEWNGRAAQIRFRTIQVCPKDLSTDLPQVERAIDRPRRQGEEA